MNAAEMMLAAIQAKKEEERNKPKQSVEIPEGPVKFIPIERKVNDKEKKRKRKEANKSRKINQHKAKKR